MQVGFWALDVVVKVVAECMNQIDGVLSGIWVGVSLLKHEGDVTNVLSLCSVCALKLTRGLFMTEQNLGEWGKNDNGDKGVITL